MRLLIDESIPVQIEPCLAEFEPSTVRRERLKGLRNGVLLRAAVDRGFTIILSADQSLRFQQNLGRIGIGAVVIVNKERSRRSRGSKFVLSFSAARMVKASA